MIKKKKLLKYNMLNKTLPTDHSYTWCIINDTDDEHMVEVQKKLFSMGIYWNGGGHNRIKNHTNIKTISFGYILSDIGFRHGDGDNWAERQIKASEFLKW
jgi:hypothetical protein